MSKFGRKVVAGVGAAGAIAVSGAALASSQPAGAGSTPSSSASSSTATTHASGAHGPRGIHASHDKNVTGTTATSVKNAVKAKDSSVTVDAVRQDPDGSYDALGTKAGKRVMVEVSKDLKTITVRAGMGPGGRGEHGPRDEHGPRGQHGPRGAEVTGATLTSVKNAVKAKDSGVTIEHAFKEKDGRYRAFGTKAGKRVMVQVSKDLKTVTTKAGMPGGHGSPGGHHGGPGRQGGADDRAGAPGSQSSRGGAGRSSSPSTAVPSVSSTQAA